MNENQREAIRDLIKANKLAEPIRKKLANAAANGIGCDLNGEEQKLFLRAGDAYRHLVEVMQNKHSQ